MEEPWPHPPCHLLGLPFDAQAEILYQDALSDLDIFSLSLTCKKILESITQSFQSNFPNPKDPQKASPKLQLRNRVRLTHPILSAAVKFGGSLDQLENYCAYFNLNLNEIIFADAIESGNEDFAMKSPSKIPKILTELRTRYNGAPTTFLLLCLRACGKGGSIALLDYLMEILSSRYLQGLEKVALLEGLSESVNPMALVNSQKIQIDDRDFATLFPGIFRSDNIELFKYILKRIPVYSFLGSHAGFYDWAVGHASFAILKHLADLGKVDPSFIVNTADRRARIRGCYGVSPEVHMEWIKRGYVVEPCAISERLQISLAVVNEEMVLWNLQQAEDLTLDDAAMLFEELMKNLKNPKISEPLKHLLSQRRASGAEAHYKVRLRLIRYFLNLGIRPKLDQLPMIAQGSLTMLLIVIIHIGVGSFNDEELGRLVALSLSYSNDDRSVPLDLSAFPSSVICQLATSAASWKLRPSIIDHYPFDRWTHKDFPPLIAHVMTPREQDSAETLLLEAIKKRAPKFFSEFVAHVLRSNEPQMIYRALAMGFMDPTLDFDSLASDLTNDPTLLGTILHQTRDINAVIETLCHSTQSPFPTFRFKEQKSLHFFLGLLASHDHFKEFTALAQRCGDDPLRREWVRNFALDSQKLCKSEVVARLLVALPFEKLYEFNPLYLYLRSEDSVPAEIRVKLKTLITGSAEAFVGVSSYYIEEFLEKLLDLENSYNLKRIRGFLAEGQVGPLASLSLKKFQAKSYRQVTLLFEAGYPMHPRVDLEKAYFMTNQHLLVQYHLEPEPPGDNEKEERKAGLHSALSIDELLSEDEEIEWDLDDYERYESDMEVDEVQEVDEMDQPKAPTLESPCPLC